MLELTSLKMDAQAMLNAVPGNHLIVRANAPFFTIVGVTDAYTAVTFTKREEIIGRNLFDVFPDNPDDKEASGVQNLANSLDYVIQNKVEHYMAHQRYDVVNAETGSFEFKIWSPLNKPVLDQTGDVIFIIHSVEDLTTRIELEAERKKSDDNLRQSENQFRTLANAIPHLAWMTDAEGSIHWYNDRWYEYTGTTSAQMAGWGWQQVHHPDMVEGVVKRFKEAISALSEWEDTFLLRSKSGEYRWFLSRAIPLWNEDGRIRGWFGTNTDITVQRNAELAVKESEARFQNLVRDATAAIVVLSGEEMKVEIVNEAYGRLIGLTPKDLLGKPIFSVIPQTEEYYRPLLDKVRQTGEPVFLYESPYTVITNGQTIEGFLHVVYQPYRNSSGAILGVMAILQDVTDSVRAKKALEASENRFRGVIEEATVGTALLEGPEWTLTIANDQMLQLWQRERSIIGKNLLSFMPELIGQPFPNILRTVYETGTTFSAQDALVQLNRNGKLEDVYMDFSYKALRNEIGNVYAILVAAVDVTERFFARKKLEESENRFRHLSEKLEDEVELRTSQLKKSNDDLQQFAHVASHDLKEPVRKIKTFAYRLQDELATQSSGRNSEYVDKILSAANRMVMMIDGVLAFSALDSSEQKIEAVDLNHIFQAIQSDLELLITAKSAKLVAADLPSIEGAGVLLYQLFYNLINNSLKFARENVPMLISITAELVSEHGTPLQKITIADNGIGFDQQFASRIFESFARLNSKDEYEGTGLGLALCKKIVERHHGSITAKGSIGSSAQFIITLPLKQITQSI
jgi:PAS domain S-box-containing protein